MDVLWVDDVSISHGGRYRLGRFLDLGAASEFLGQKISRVRHPDAQAFPGNAFGLAISDVVTREDGDVWTKYAFRPARHDESDSLFDAVGGQTDTGR